MCLSGERLSFCAESCRALGESGQTYRSFHGRTHRWACLCNTKALLLVSPSPLTWTALHPNVPSAEEAARLEMAWEAAGGMVLITSVRMGTPQQLCTPMQTGRNLSKNPFDCVTHQDPGRFSPSTSKKPHIAVNCTWNAAALIIGKFHWKLFYLICFSSLWVIQPSISSASFYDGGARRCQESAAVQITSLKQSAAQLVWRWLWLALNIQLRKNLQTTFETPLRAVIKSSYVS